MVNLGKNVKLPRTMPERGAEIVKTYRVDGRPQRVALTGADYNRALWEKVVTSRHAQEMAAQGYVMRADSFAPPALLRHTKQEIWEEQRAPMDAFELVPMDSEAGAFADAEEYEFLKVTDVGKAAITANLGGVSEYPKVDNFAVAQKVPIVNAVISYSITQDEELRQARLPYNILDRKAKMAREAIERTFNEFLLRGGDGHQGLYNNTDFTAVTADTPNHYTGGATTEQIISDIVKLYSSAVDKLALSSITSASTGPDTLVMSWNLHKFYSQVKTFDSAGGPATVMDVLKQRLPEITNWYFTTDLNESVDANTDRVYLYRKDPRVLAAAVPVLYQEGVMVNMPHFYREVAAFGRIAPLVVHDKRYCHYMDINFSA